MNEADLRKLLDALDRLAVVLEGIRKKLPPIESGVTTREDLPQ